MEAFLEGRFSWAFFLTSVLVLIGIYFLLKLCLRIAQNISVLGRYRPFVIRYLEHAILLMEPIALVILATMFILIAPRIHGIVALIVGIGALSQIRNYFHGRAILFGQQIEIDTPIQTNNVVGRVTEVGRLGIRVRNSDGLYFVNYASLLNDGYALSSEETIGGYYQLQVAPKDEIDLKGDPKGQLRTLLIASPYIDTDNAPVIEQADNKMLVRVSVRNKEHLNDLMTLIEDRGYHVVLN